MDLSFGLIKIEVGMFLDMVVASHRKKQGIL
jgi:hypothetical protein